ncbi:MAG: hypothetical protein RLY86_968 [Pseudomonadota bacterium]
MIAAALPPDGPPTLVLIPGLLCDGRLWREQQAALAVTGRSVVIADITGADHVDAMADGILGAEPGPLAVAGFSLGGIVAMALVRRAPGRVARLALLNTTARPDPQERQAIRHRQIAEAEAGRLGEMVAAELLPRYFGGPVPDSLPRAVLDMALSLGPAVFRTQSRALMSRADARAWLPQVRVPTLVLAAEHDALCSVAIHREIADAIPGARMEIIPGCGHMAPMEAPASVADALNRWLAEP